MIYSIKGILVHTEPNLAVIECDGIGYACRTTAYTLSALKLGEETFLFTYLHVREDALELFGFNEQQELEIFKQLLTVNGVGPKVALSILSEMTPQGFMICVISGDGKALTRCPGVGIKTAQRIVLELKDKFSKDTISDSLNVTEVSLPSTNSVSEAVSALTALGFTNAQAQKALSGLDSSLSAPELIKAALKKMS